jgi:glutaredoxin 2
MWLTKSREDLVKTEENVKQHITKLSQICSVDEHDLTDLDRLIKRLQGAVQQELKEFIAFPLHLLDNLTLPS